MDIEVTAFGYSGALVQLLTPGDKVHEIIVASGTAVTGWLEFEGKPCADTPIAVVQVDRSRSDRPFIKAVLATTNILHLFKTNYTSLATPATALNKCTDY